MTATELRARMEDVIAGVMEDHPGPGVDAVAEDAAAAVLADLDNTGALH